MSAITPYKRGNESVSVNDIAAGNSIAIGRGFEEVVSQKSWFYAASAPFPEDLPTPAPAQFATPAQQADYQAKLDKLMGELQHGEGGNILTIQQQLIELKLLRPDLAPALRIELENKPGLSTPIRILARHCLA